MDLEGNLRRVVLYAVDMMAPSNAISRMMSTVLGQIDATAQTISSVSAQTNLLALNTTIKSARAGDAGRLRCCRRRGEIPGRRSETLSTQIAGLVAETQSKIDGLRIAQSVGH